MSIAVLCIQLTITTFVQFASFVIIRDFLMPILCQRLRSLRSQSRIPRLNEWHESSKSEEITGFLDSTVSVMFSYPKKIKPTVRKHRQGSRDRKRRCRIRTGIRRVIRGRSFDKWAEPDDSAICGHEVHIIHDLITCRITKIDGITVSEDHL
uniref:Uncharacterized protein n=1 Tax=Candidatus Methanogaster sp. ANME-2c ERB4 TaxID=2759911 RepID=A0A7G9YGG7_9EURY|nr:hypothetical protein ONOHIMFI_00027 [Methanosarcinales archaeon ANME-2c ERB4]